MEAQSRSARLIGAIFVDMGVITDEQLAEALARQRTTGELIGEIVVSKFGVSRLALASALAEQKAERDTRRAASEPEAEADGAVDAVGSLTSGELDAAIRSALAPVRAEIEAVEACLASFRERLDALERHSA